MKTIMITAPSSGSGKTIVTMGIIRALRNRGLRVCGFKTGPDYIDRGFLELALDKAAGNLDIHLQGEEGMKDALALGDGDYCVIEGVMGYYDGIYNTFQNSSYDISNRLGIASVLIYNPRGEMFTAVPKIKGMVEFENSNIRAVILNKTSKSIYDLMKPQIEKYTNIRVLGYIPPMEAAEIGSRHLGLIQRMEISDIEDRLKEITEVLSTTVDLDGLIQLMEYIVPKEIIKRKKRNIRVAIAMDDAFSFYYRENLYLLEKICQVDYFTPLGDRSIPKCDLLYIGGGYPELFMEELSQNTSMLDSINAFAEAGGCIYAECGGFMYLNKTIEGRKAVGIFNGQSQMTKTLQRFGYIDIQINRSCLLGKKGDKLKGHEFHKSKTDIGDVGTFDIKKTMGERAWQCGYSYKNVLAGYPHISFIGNISSFEHMLNYVEERRTIDNR